ncbi:MAG: YfhO family protein [Bacteroidota bacterium]
MSKLNFKQQVLPHLVSVSILAIVTILFFSPMFFGNRVIEQNDVIQGISSGKEIVDYRERTGEEALWTNSMFGGMPAYLINIKYEGEGIINFFQKVFSLGFPRQAEVILKCMLSFYVLLIVFKVRPYLALIGAIAYGLGTFNIVSLEAGHIWKIEAIAYMPLVLAGIHLTYRGKLLGGFALTALALALEIDSNHLQITYYLLLTVLFYGIAMLVHAIRQQDLQPFLIRSGVLVAAALLAVGTNFGRIWNTYQYGQYSTRGPSALVKEGESRQEGLDRDYVFNYSLTVAETMTLFVPDFSGGASNRNIGMDSNLAEFLQSANLNRQQVQNFVQNAPTYWGGKIPSTAGPTYAGAIIVFLFFIGCFFAPQPHRTWLVAATVFSVMLAWGRFFPSFNYLLYDIFPGYNKFRTVEMAMVIALLCIPLLGLIGLESLLRSAWNDKTRKRLFIATGIPLGILVLLIVLAGSFSFEGSVDSRYLAQQGGDLIVDALQDDRADLLRSDALRSLVFCLLAGVAIFFHRSEKLGYLGLAAALVFLSTVDLWSVGKRFLTEDDYVRERNRMAVVNATEADQFIIQQNTSHARTLNLAAAQGPFNDAVTSYFHASIGGYHGAKLGRYQDLVENHLGEEMNRAIQSLQQGQRDFTNTPALNMLNTRYIKAGEAQNAVIVNEQALGNAWLVSEIKSVENANEAIEALGTINPAQTAVVNTNDFELLSTSFSGEGEISLVQYEPNYLKYEANVPAESFAVFSEIYYPDGWEVKIDGQETDYLRANYLLRALPIPAGQHTIEFSFNPTSYRVGSTVSLISSVLLLLIVVAALVFSFRPSSNQVAVA